ncbi:malonyl-CoA decarboxylase, mitochondrial-like isoform X2 [Limulus polyphemus]|uniref:Malonyl-CoA decarboxylase, mitochondrial-like isoform X2 n=1 Tax=Limulus polyphemus TaxID=6850 RepID=A0ABM1SM62_LIMPO|nr:malonyl-CoA decarboxylase, mitochondrial-like isoform X2 [Limulus polyphemus]
MVNLFTSNQPSPYCQFNEDTVMLCDSNIQRMKLLLKDTATSSSSVSVESKTKLLCSIYLQLKSQEKADFLRHLVMNYGVNHSSVQKCARSFLSSQEQGESSRIKAEENLRSSLTPYYIGLFGHIGRLEGGVKFLVDLRKDVLYLLSMLEPNKSIAPNIKALNKTLRDLLSLWFSAGFMRLQRVTWDSSCDMLQKISEYEAVHPVRSWGDLKLRVGPYRRCYVFTHSSMPKEPIVVLHTALTTEISTSIQSIVNHAHLQLEEKLFQPLSKDVVEDPKNIHAAVFYSISSTQKGLQGIELGTQLIKQAVKDVLAEFPRISLFSTLSPVPGFRDWLLLELSKDERGALLSSFFLTDEEYTSLKDHLCKNNAVSVREQILEMLKSNQWLQDANLSELLKVPFMRLCAQYLYREKRRGYALNSVAHFHLRNGACIWRLNWLADKSPRGLTSSCGIMVNYRYFLEATEINSQRYIEKQHVEASEQFLHLLGLSHHKSSL